jgi:hypothetical protein
MVDESTFVASSILSFAGLESLAHRLGGNAEEPRGHALAATRPFHRLVEEQLGQLARGRQGVREY